MGANKPDAFGSLKGSENIHVYKNVCEYMCIAYICTYTKIYKLNTISK